MALFANLSQEEKNKIHFIHFNHTNPLLDPQSEQSKLVLDSGYNIARINDVFSL
jgi:pyrroloquinoline quinone biosynthesis protein B